MFNWIRRWKIFRRRRQRKYLQKELLFLLRNEHLLIPPSYFLCRLRDYDETTFDPILIKRADRLKQIWNHSYSRVADRERAFNRTDRDFLEAVKYAL